MRGGWPSWGLAALVALVLVAGVALWWRAGGRTARRAAAPAGAPAGPRAGDAVARRIDPAPGDAIAARPTDPAPGDAAPSADDPLAALGQAPRGPWAAVDLDAVRAAMPDNVYWTMSAPTKDPEVLRQREEERARWNVAYGKVLSNTATEEEIGAYYAHRERLSNDYVEFATHVLAEYGEKLPKRDVALLKLAVDMHLARLEEIPRQIAEALERREAHEAARRAWLEDQQAFEGDPPEGP